MAVNRSSFQNQMKFNVMEVKFIRRHDKPGSALTRRGLFTTSYPLLNSPIGKKIFRFDPPRYPPTYNYAGYNLACGFDCVVSLDWRMIPCESATIIQKFRVSTLKEQREFWEFFQENFQNMSIEQRRAITNL